MKERIYFDNSKNKLSIEDNMIPYHMIDCYEAIEKYEVVLQYNIWKMIYQFIFAPVLPTHEILDTDDKSSKSNNVVCTQLHINIWIKDKTDPIYINLLPNNELCNTKKRTYKTNHEIFLNLKHSLDKTFKMLYGSNFQDILLERLNNRTQ